MPVVRSSLLAALALALAPATRAHEVPVVKRVQLGNLAQGLVRSQMNTKDDPSHTTLDPVCASASTDGHFEDATCAAVADELAVPFNTRSYVQAHYDGACDHVGFGGFDYRCVDYDAGALHLSGTTLSFEVDLSADGCGCNAAVYLVSMPQSDDASACADFYCDANDVCGARCTEIDLMEANTVAWVSTVHVADDGAGEGFGYAHYVQPPEKQLRSDDAECAYGPAAECAIDTRRPFTAAFEFTPPDEPFGFDVTLSQEGRRARLGPVRYEGKPQQGGVPTADAANAALRASLDAGMTLVVSHWAGETKASMGWLDSPCAASEVEGWHCTDAFVQHPEWTWRCDGDDRSPPSCERPYTLRRIHIDAPSPPPPPPTPTQAPVAVVQVHGAPTRAAKAGAQGYSAVQMGFFAVCIVAGFALGFIGAGRYTGHARVRKDEPAESALDDVIE
jgi:hypothetical protein